MNLKGGKGLAGLARTTCKGRREESLTHLLGLNEGGRQLFNKGSKEKTWQTVIARWVPGGALAPS